MINLFTGTPGSGKSLHMAQMIWYKLKFSKQIIISNVDINLDEINEKHHHRFIYIPDNEFTLQRLMDEYMNIEYLLPDSVRAREGFISLFIDEAQLYFNAREWSQKGRDNWLQFFTTHRHLGFNVYLMCQFDRMIDKQIRSLVEYQYIHRTLGNFGWKGWLLALCMLSRPKNMIVCVQVWYPIQEKIGSEFTRVSLKYCRLYDTHKKYVDFETKLGVNV